MLQLAADLLVVAHFAFICFVLLGGLLVWFPQVYGVGYETIDGALNGTLLLPAMLVLLLLKILATSLTLGSGGSGGGTTGGSPASSASRSTDSAPG